MVGAVPSGPSGYRSLVSPARIKDTERQAEAVRLRIAGKTFDEIAEQCGYTDKSSAYGSVRRAVQRIGREQAEELFDVDMARFEAMWAEVWPLFIDHQLSVADRLKALNGLLDIMQRKARMLGYDNVTVTANTSSESVTTSVPSLAELVGTDAGGELEQSMARMLHDSLPATVVDQQPDEQNGGSDG